MPNKAHERFCLEALRRALPEFPSGDAREPEPPDFLLVVRYGHRLGIELTTFHLPPAPGTRPHQEQQNLKDQIVENAERLHHEAGGPGLYVSIFFDEHRPLTKKDIQSLAHAIKDAVLSCRLPSSFKEPAVEMPWEDLPECIDGIVIDGSVDGVDELWEADAGGWVAKVTQEHVAQVVRAKARRAPLARSRCDELWLVIVNDVFSGAAPAEVSNEALEATYEGPFDRLIWLLPHAPRAIDLRLRQPVVW